jgi:hypothetical protein
MLDIFTLRTEDIFVVIRAAFVGNWVGSAFEVVALYKQAEQSNESNTMAHSENSSQLGSEDYRRTEKSN